MVKSKLSRLILSSNYSISYQLTCIDHIVGITVYCLKFQVLKFDKECGNFYKSLDTFRLDIVNVLTIGGAEIARPDIARPDKTSPGQTARLNKSVLVSVAPPAVNCRSTERRRALSQRLEHPSAEEEVEHAQRPEN